MKKVNFKPSPGLFLVEVKEVKPREKKKGSDIYLPDQVKSSNKLEIEEVFDEHPFQATIVAKGDEVDNIKSDVEVGDLVYLRRMLTSSDAVLVDNKVYAVIRQSDIFGKVIK